MTFGDTAELQNSEFACEPKKFFIFSISSRNEEPNEPI